MKSFTPCHLWSLILGLPLACGGVDSAFAPGADDAVDFGASLDSPAAPQVNLKASPLEFPGGGTSAAAQTLSVALGPDTSSACDPVPSAASVASEADVQTICFYGADSPDVPAATIEQVVEVVGNSEWVHFRLTLNPDFVDNTYGDNAIGWGDVAEEPVPADGMAPPQGGAPEPPAAPGAGMTPPPPRDGRTPPAPPPPAGELPAPDAPPAAGEAPDAPAPPAAGEAPDAPNPPRPPRGGGTPPDAPPPPAGDAAGEPPPPPPDTEPGRPRDGEPAARPARPKKGGHTFKDLVGSDHAEIQLLDANGNVSVHFKLDYLSESSSAASGFASLGVSGGEGALIVGEPEWLLASTTSIDRNLNACGLSSFTESSPSTDDLYTPDPTATDWDYRVSYEAWVSTEAFGAAGFGSALIENVHASPSKLDGNTVDVKPAPCPIDPSTPEVAPEPLPGVLQNIR